MELYGKSNSSSAIFLGESTIVAQEIGFQIHELVESQLCFTAHRRQSKLENNSTRLTSHESLRPEADLLGITKFVWVDVSRVTAPPTVCAMFGTDLHD